MDVAERNRALARDGLEAFNRGDIEAVLAFLDGEIETHVHPSMMNTGTWHGHDGYLQMIATWGEAWEDLHFEILELETVGDRHVLAHVHQTAAGRGSGVPVEMDVVFLFEVVDGRALRFQVHPDREGAVAAI
jgi:ketosteroid isomerase-like protein